MDVTFEQHVGQLPSGKQVELAQWRVFVNGQLAGYLPHDPSVHLMLIYNPTEQDRVAIEKKCEEFTGRTVLPHRVIYMPSPSEIEAYEHKTGDYLHSQPDTDNEEDSEDDGDDC